MSETTGYRPPADVRRDGNRLQDEPSLYLRQHARNPVDWHPWGDEALALAGRTNRPIFLSSGYSSCHWCHVMEDEVFEHEDVAEVLNRHFVSIKVDREERPVIDATYMEAVQRLTGRGGWPMSVFLTPDLEPFFGGTYFPRPQFLSLLEQIVALWRDRPDELEEQARRLAASIRAEPDVRAAGELDEGWLARAVARTADAYDAEHGGFEAPMKFPVPVRWTFLLHWYRKTADPTVERMLDGTLDAMARGGLYDHVGGGFHRYTVDRDWTVPHFEKMLYDNAQLASLYLEAGAALGRADHTAVGVDVLEFLDREMTGPEGAVYASFDADSGGEEGTYYVWSPDQIAGAVGDRDGPPLAALLGVTGAGNFEHGTSVVTRRSDAARIADHHDRSAEDVAALFGRHRERLRAVRDERIAPGLDRKVITAWNGLALSAFARGALATGRADFRARAEAIAAFLRGRHRAGDGRLARSSDGERTVGAGTLEDYALLGRGLLDLFQLTGEAAHLAWASEIVDIVRDDFARRDGLWYTAPGGGDAPLGRRVDLTDSVVPGGCSAMLDLILTHGTITGDTGAAELVSRELSRHGRLIEAAGLEMAGWLDVALRLEGPLHEVIVAGDPDDAGFASLWGAIAPRLSPAVVLLPVPAQGADAELVAIAPTVHGKAAMDGHAAGWVCNRGSCLAPTTDPLQIETMTREGWVR
ncbi:DUF255 domain-containing protein [bacterium]|nr:DUF255 domain-containing protein [bacterium]